MVIKKPYAFLIKNFKLIHLLIFIILVFIAIKTNYIFDFFNDYATSGYYTYYNDLSEQFINFWMYLAIILVLMFTVTIFFLLKWKDKKRKYYLFLIGYYVLLFASLIYISFVLENIVTTSFGMKEIRTFRDITILMYFPQYFFIVYTLIRALGFDFKTFEFQRDIKELEINLKDSEEVEIVLNDNTYKIFRKTRKIIREFKYYIVENKYMFSIIVFSIVLLISLIILFNRKNFNNDIYNENTFFNTSTFRIKVNNSYITNTDYKGNIINQNKKYIIISLNVTNNYNLSKQLTSENFKLLVNNKKISPIFTLNNSFIDFGNGYTKEFIDAGSTIDTFLVYELDADIETNKYILTIVKTSSMTNDKIVVTYKETNLKPIDKLNKKDTLEYVRSNEILFNDSVVNETKLKINSYELADTFRETNKYCIKEDCYDITKTIKPNVVGTIPRMVLKMNVNFSFDETSIMKKYISTSADFFNKYLTITYTYNLKNTTIQPEVLIDNAINSTNNVYVFVPSDIKNASKIYANITIRNQVYRILLK